MIHTLSLEEFLTIIACIVAFVYIGVIVAVKYFDIQYGDLYKSSSNSVNVAGGDKYNNIVSTFQPNPIHQDGMDCFIRALCKYYNKSWDEVYDILSSFAKSKKLILDNQKVVLSYFEEHGFDVKLIEDKNISFSVACKRYSKQYDTFFLIGNNHIVCCDNDFIYDSWDSRCLKVFYLITKKKEEKPVTHKFLNYMSKCHGAMSKRHKNK